jgi:YggT family protein
MGLVLATSLLIFIRVISFIVLVDVIISYFTNPYQPIRAFLDRLVEPMLDPIRKIVPPMGGFDFSPVVLLILLQILEAVVRNI